MGCAPCQQKAAMQAEINNQAQAAQAVKNSVNNTYSEPTNKYNDCMEMYYEVKTLNQRAVDLFNKFRKYETVEGQFGKNDYRDWSNRTAFYMRELTVKCPEEKEFSALSDRINSEYFKHFSK